MTQKMKKGLKTLIVGIVLFIAGGVVIPFVIILPFFLSDLGSENQFLIPGSLELKVEDPGRYYLWNDFQTVYEGKTYHRSEDLPDGLEIMVLNSDGVSLPFVSNTSISSNVGSSSKNSIGYVEVEHPGRLTVSVLGDLEPRVFSFSPFEFMKLFGQIFLGMGLSILIGVVGFGLVIWGIVKLVQNNKSAERSA